MRQEKDALGVLMLDDDVYYGIQTERARLNCLVLDQTVMTFPKLIWSIAAIKKSVAMANRDIGVLDEDITDAICTAADEIMDGKMKGQFLINLYQGGGGTSLNMNVNEVIANRANELLTGYKGYDHVHPNTHVNMAQSTNDVIPSAVKMTCYLYLQSLLKSLNKIEKVLKNKVNEFEDVVKVSRTCLQDAVPITLGQEFSGYLSFIQRQIKEIKKAQNDCLIITVGATAVGTGLGTLPGYLESFYKYLPKVSDVPVKKSDNFFDGVQNADVYLKVSSTLKILATGLSKMANDFRLLSSGPRAGLSEIIIPAVQPGSSIMPGKVNPVIPEMMMQVCFQVYGNDQTITIAVDRGELDINVWENIIMKNLFESIQLLDSSIDLFAEKCVKGIKANREFCQQNAESSLSNSTIISALFGYELAVEVGKEAYNRGMTIKDVVIEKKILTESEADRMLDPLMLTKVEESGLILSEFDNK